MQAHDKASVGTRVSLRELIARFRWQIACTWFLVVVEAALMLLFPLLLGMAVDGMRQQTHFGLYMLGGLGALAVLVAAARRIYDTRVYSRIYVAAGKQIVEQERQRKTDVSVITARTNMANELVEFLENSFPGIVECVIGLAGTLAMIWVLQARVFAGCLVGTAVIVVIYAVTRNRTYALNQGVNHAWEKQVQVLAHGRMSAVSAHFTDMMCWNVRLSDLETVNFALSWLVMVVLLVYSVVATIGSGVAAQGVVLSILMYVVGYIESVVAVPVFYQQFVRLQEISHRLNSSSTRSAACWEAS